MPCTIGPRFELLRPLPTIFAHLSVLIRLPFHCLLNSLPPSPILSFSSLFPFYFLSKLSSSLLALEVEASSFGWLMVRSVFFSSFHIPQYVIMPITICCAIFTQIVHARPGLDNTDTIVMTEVSFQILPFEIALRVEKSWDDMGPTIDKDMFLLGCACIILLNDLTNSLYT